MNGLLAYAILFAASPAREGRLIVGMENGLTKVFREDPSSVERDRTLRLELARNEYEGGQLVLIAGDSDVEEVRLDWTDLAHQDGTHRIDRRYIRLRFVGYTAPTAIRSKEVLDNRKLRPGKPRSYPDLLLMDRTMAIEARRAQPVWVTVFAPPDAVPGWYSGDVSITSAGEPVATAKLEVRVWNFALPASPPLYVWYYNDFNSLARNWLGVSPSDWDLYKKAFRGYVREIARHRGSIAPPLDYTAGRRFEEIMQIMIDEGCEFWWVTWFWRSGYVNRPLEEQRRIAGRIYDYMKRKGLLDATFFVTWDEPDLREEKKENRAKWERHIRVLKEIGFPRIQVDMTWRCATATAFMEPYPTVWNPQFSYFEGDPYYDFLQKQREEGDIIGFYLTGSGNGQEPRHYIPFPLTEMRRLFYYMWQHGLTLCEFWALDVTWRGKGADPLRMVTAGGYGGGTSALIYPNRDGDVTEPILSSIRFEAIRDGIEDYCYLWVLSQWVDRAEKAGKRSAAEAGRKVLREIPARLGAHLRDFQRSDPAGYIRARERLADAIVRLKGDGPDVLLPKRKFRRVNGPGASAAKNRTATVPPLRDSTHAFR